MEERGGLLVLFFPDFLCGFEAFGGHLVVVSAEYAAGRGQ